MIVDHTRKFAFTSVPKTGSTTIMLHVCENKNVINEQKPAIYHASLNVLDSTTNGYFKFGFVRDPLDRFLSTYLDGLQDGGHIIEWSGNLLNYNTFKEFCLNFTNDNIRHDVHFSPGYTFFYDKDGKNLASKIFRYENFSEACNEISRAISITVDPSYITRQTKKDKHFLDYYDKESAQPIINFYKHDYDIFGYEIPFT